MIGLAARLLVGLALLCVPVGYLALAGLPSIGGELREAPADRPSEPGRERERPGAGERSGAGAPPVAERRPAGGRGRAEDPGDGRGPRAVAADVLRRAGLAALALGGPLLAVRTIARHRRRVARYRISVPRADRPAPERVAGMIEALHRVLQRERGIARLLLGQPHMALEWHSLPDRSGAELVVCLVCPPALAPEADAILSSCYPNARLGHEFAPPPVPWERPISWSGRMVRLRKGRSPVLRVGGVVGAPEGAGALEAAMAAAGARPAAVGVQLRLAPAPVLLERWVRGRVRAAERAADRGRRAELLTGPGLSGPLARAEAEGALEIAHRAAFWSELWVLGEDERSVRAVAGTLQALGGEAPLRRRRAWNPLHRRRVQEARPGIVSSWNLLFSPEVASLWRLPSPLAGLVPAARSALPRLPAPPGVARAHPEEALVLTERGGVRLRPPERPLGVGLVGLQGAGKTAALVASIAADARDPDCALIVLDPKSDLARQALSAIPEGRTVWHLSFGAPEFGINPLLVEAEGDAVADAFIGALMDLNEDGAIRASSDRYLRYAVAGARAYAAARGLVPTVWLVHELLDPSADALRARVAAVCRRDPDLVHAGLFFERSLPDQLVHARSMTTVKLDAPSNKLQRLLGKTADQVLHHPVQLSLDRILSRREVLIVDGAMGSVGPDTASKLLQILLRLVFASLQRQQERPQPERARLSLVIDEAHWVVNRTLARMMAVGRSGGLELVAAWQHSEQFADPEVRAAIDELLRHRLTFAAGAEDSRAAAVQAMTGFADVIRDDAETRELQRVLPDVIRHLPQFHAICSWVVEGARAEPFLARTIRAGEDPARIAHHLEGQRRREIGGLRPHHPPALPNPLADLDGPPGPIGSVEEAPARPEAARARRGARAPQLSMLDGAEPGGDTAPARAGDNGVGASVATAAGGDATSRGEGERLPAPSASPPAGAGNAPPEPMAAAPALESASEPASAAEVRAETAGPAASAAEPGAAELADASPEPAGPPAPAGNGASPGAREEAGAAPPEPRLGAVESYREVQIDAPTGIFPETIETLPAGEIPAPRPAEVEALRLLYRARFLLPAQVGRAVGWGSERSAQRNLARLATYGWVRRYRLRAETGRPRLVYSLTQSGLNAAREQVGRERSHPPPEGGWSESSVTDPRRVLHDLHLAGYALALERVLGPERVRVWHGPRASLARPVPPAVGRGGERRAVLARELPLPKDRSVLEVAEPFERIESDAVLELILPAVDATRRRIDLFLELDRTRRPSKSAGKFRAYDAFITGWSMALARYAKLGEPPWVLFVCDDEPQARAFARAADAHVAGRVAVLRTPERDWSFPGRERMLFACERDVHEGSRQAWRLPAMPPDVRARLGVGHESEPEPIDLPEAVDTTGDSRPRAREGG